MWELVRAVNRCKGKVVESQAKGGVLLELQDAAGLLAVVTSGSDQLGSLLRVVTLALAAGNAVMIASAASSDLVVQQLIRYAKKLDIYGRVTVQKGTHKLCQLPDYCFTCRSAKDSGVPAVLGSCNLTDENSRALLKHHGVSKLILMGSSTLPESPGSHIQTVWKVGGSEEPGIDEIGRNVTHRKWIWMAVGDGLGQ